MEDIEDSDFVACEHDRLICAVSKLDKTQHITEPTRNEPTNQSSEFNLIRRANKLDIDKVVKVLKDTAHHVEISKRLKKTQEASKILPKPLEKPQAQRIKRATGYEETKKKVGRWDAVVARSRTVDFVSFPLKNAETKLQPTVEFLSKLKLKSSLEKELDEIDPPPAIEESEDEEQTYPMSYEEMVEHRKQTAKMRAQESYKAAKAKRQSKIKSKKYHRILKKEKLKQQLKEFEELQKNNPEEALKKLEALEKARALERHTLRHKNTGKWAKSKLVRAKYDKEVRQELAEQLAVSRGLTHKTQDNQISDDDADDECIPNMTLSQDPMNPWMMATSGKTNVNTEFNFAYKKYLNEKRMKPHTESSDSEDEKNDANDKIQTSSVLECLKEGIRKLYKNNDIHPEKKTEHVAKPDSKVKKTQQENAKAKNKPMKLIATSNWTVELISDKIELEDVSSAFESLESKVALQVEKKLAKLRKNIEGLEKVRKPKEPNKQGISDNKDNIEYLKFKNQKTKPIIDEALDETTKKSVDDTDNSETITAKMLKNSALHNQGTHSENTKSDIDPSTFIEVKPKYLNTALSDYNECDQLDDDEQVVPKVNIEDVFEEDDVVASFRQEKEDENNKDQPQDIDLSLPGWGSWGGKGVKAPKRKRNRFILKAPPKMPRRDENKGDIIIKEYKDPKLALHKLTDIPFPFTSVKEFEASIRTPLGNTFIPEKAHKKLIKPSVITKAGVIIEPMDEDELLVKKNRSFRNESVLKLIAKK